MGESCKALSSDERIVGSIDTARRVFRNSSCIIAIRKLRVIEFPERVELGGVNLKLSIYLLREEVKSFSDALQEKHLEGDSAFRELSPSKTLPYECKAYVQTTKATEPRWLRFLSTHFKPAFPLKNSSNSFVLILRAAERLFAVTFGYGFNALDRAKMEPQFGLKVSLNALDNSQIRTVDTRNIDMVTRQRRTHMNIGSPMSEFGLNTDLDWVRYIAGKPNNADLAKSVAGSDSLSINCESDLESLAEKCAELLRLFHSDTYKESFRFVDYIQPLRHRDGRIERLDSEVKQRIDARSRDRISVAYPELVDQEQLSCYRLAYRSKRKDIEEVTLEEIYHFLTTYPDIGSPLDDVSIIGIDEHEKPVTHKHKLRHYLVSEVEEDDGTYVLSLGQWFRVDGDYVRVIRQQVNSLEDITDKLNLPPFNPREDEGSYNRRVAEIKDWYCLDKLTFGLKGSRDKVEICDLLTPDPVFICVKKMTSSATLSHLFSQASVSARLLRNYPPYRERLSQLASQKWPGFHLAAAGTPAVRFVYAIATGKAGPLASSMFFFSLINLVDHANAIREVGFDVALCKIKRP